jgi:lytic murein transglycosylase
VSVRAQNSRLHAAWSWRLALSAFVPFAMAIYSPALRPLEAQAQTQQDGFRAFLQTLWPEAQKLGVTRAVFDAAFKDLAPDLTLPDLILPGREKAQPKGQAEFTRPPQDYLNKTQLERLSQQGRSLALRHADSLKRIETEIGVDGTAVLAIWGRETAFGTYKLQHDAIRVLATQAYFGRRKDMFRAELLAALRLLQDGIPRTTMKASWAGAMGLTQFMPTEFSNHGYDLDRDGRIDLFTSVPDALASAAKQLKNKGWVLGLPWGFEVQRPDKADCALEGPGNGRKIADWVRLGYAPVKGRTFAPEQMAVEAYLMQPAGVYGPVFLVTENFKVIRRYNTSDLYALFVGNLTDRIAGLGDFHTPWAEPKMLATRDIEEIQRLLLKSGQPVEKIDGKIGSGTRQQIGAYQNAAKLTADCWPTEALLKQMRAAYPAAIQAKP